MQLLYDNKMPNQQRFSGCKEKQFQHKSNTIKTEIKTTLKLVKQELLE